MDETDITVTAHETGIWIHCPDKWDAMFVQNALRTHMEQHADDEEVADGCLDVIQKLHDVI